MTPLLDLLTVVVLAWFGSRLVVSFRRSLDTAARARSLEILAGLRARHVAPVPLVLAAVVGAALLLVQVPGLSFGWWTAIGGEGNPAFGITDRTVGTPLATLVPLVFVVLLVPALPLLVEREERMFRLGAEQWSVPRRVVKAVVFGLVHAIVGIPIGVALALSIGGWWFTLAYLRGYREGGRWAGVLESTRCHLAYNGVIVALVGLAFLLDAVLLLLGEA